MAKLLEVRDLATNFSTEDGVVKAVDGISYDLEEGEVLGIVGESGSGKSVGALSLMRLIPFPPGKIVRGEVVFDGQDLMKVNEAEMRNVRGNKMTMVFQEPMTSLNPVLTVERQITESLQLHKGMDKTASRERALELMRMVGIPDPENRIKNYPHQFSGGMRQRVMIAMAISCDPRLIIADEPTTALDVTIQAQILDLMTSLSAQLGTALIIITHNLGVVARYADRVAVMYAGKIVEEGYAKDIYANPKHPYTVGLLNSVPRLDRDRQDTLDPIEGMPPDLIDIPNGCSFAPRCRYAYEKCTQETPQLESVSDAHTAACWRSDELDKLVGSE
mgnify:CR=1 FL=1